MAIGDRYLGNGVFASAIGSGIALYLSGQESCSRIVLMPSVLVALDGFKADLAIAIHEERSCPPPNPNP